MAAKDDKAAVKPEPVEEEALELSFFQQLRLITSSITRSHVGKALTFLIGMLLIIVIVTAYGQIRLNRWNKPFYDALSRRDMHDFVLQLGVFAIIAGGLLVLNVIQRWLVETLKVKLREGLVRDLLRDWMRPRRAFWLANAGGVMGVNPDQRMHEDARKLCELTADLGVGLLQATILFGTFAGVLWVLSAGFTFRFGGVDYEVPGFMLWAAIVYALVGSLLSYWVGRSLIDRNADRYGREADLRFSLVRINEHLDGISLAGGEHDEERRVEMHLKNVLTSTRRLVTGLTNLTWITAGFGWITTVAPILVAVPLYFGGKMSFGGLMMAAAAFTQAQSSLRWFVDNFSTIADWRATLLRVAGFRQALIVADEPGDFESRITYEKGPPDALRFESLDVISPSGHDMLRERDVTIRAGERVLILGAPDTSKTLLFRALAGLWPWGTGRVVRPGDEQILYLPRGTPYLPRGNLRDVLAYPLKVDRFSQAAFEHALTRMGLQRLIDQMGKTRRWDQELSQDELLALAFARIVLQAPAWVLVDDLFAGLDDTALERIVEVFAHELKHTTVIHIGRAAQVPESVFTQTLHLVNAPGASATSRRRAISGITASRKGHPGGGSS